MPASVRAALSADHARMERVFRDLVEAVDGGDPLAIQRTWETFERALMTHLDIEERFLLPKLEASNPEEVAAIRHEHARIRKLVADLGVCTEIHTLRKPVVDALLEQLRLHASREDRMLYPWADELLDKQTRRAVVDAIKNEGVGHRAAG